jgi:hypothetical protein
VHHRPGDPRRRRTLHVIRGLKECT